MDILHSLGIEAPIISISLGAEIIEKHLTLNNKMEGPDHVASMEPKLFSVIAIAIRKAEIMLGNGKKIPTNIELINKKLVRKSIVAKAKIKKGERFSIKNITTKRPGTGKSPMSFEKVLSTKAKKNYQVDDFI